MKNQTREVLRSVANTIVALTREPRNTDGERQHLHTAADALWCAIDWAHARAELTSAPAQDDVLEDPEVMRNADARAARKYELD